MYVNMGYKQILPGSSPSFPCDWMISYSLETKELNNLKRRGVNKGLLNTGLLLNEPNYFL